MFVNFHTDGMNYGLTDFQRLLRPVHKVYPCSRPLNTSSVDRRLNTAHCRAMLFFNTAHTGTHYPTCSRSTCCRAVYTGREHRYSVYRPLHSLRVHSKHIVETALSLLVRLFVLVFTKSHSKVK